MRARNILGLVAVTILITTVIAAADEPLKKSDLSKNYIDPDEIRPIIKSKLEGCVEVNSGSMGLFAGRDSNEVKLIDSYIPIYELNGNVVGYFFVGYIGGESVPTFDRLIEASIESKDDLDNALRVNKYDSTNAYRKYFPYALDCVYARVGTGVYGPNISFILSPGLPEFILRFKEAKTCAETFLNHNVEFVNLLIIPGYWAYEFSDGETNVLVPFDEMGTINRDEMKTRAEADADKGQELYPAVDEMRVETWRDWWRRLLNQPEEHSKNGLDEYWNNMCSILPTNYFAQTYFDDYGHIWKYSPWDYTNKHPVIPYSTPRQYSLFGTCLPISLTVSVVHLEYHAQGAGGSGKKLNRNMLEGSQERGLDGVSYPYPATNDFSLSISGQGPDQPPYNISYMCCIIGAIYHYSSGFSFFDRGQDQLHRGNLNESAALSSFTSAMSSFSASSYYTVKTQLINGEGLTDWSVIVWNIEWDHPIIALNNAVDYCHCNLIIGYEGFDPQTHSLDLVNYWDWTSTITYPSTVPIKEAAPGYFRDYKHIVCAPYYDTTASFVNNVRAISKGLKSTLSWESDGERELDVIGYNIIDLTARNRPLNNELIRPQSRFGKKTYEFKLEPGINAASLAVEVRFKNGSIEVYKPANAEEGSRNAQ